MLATWLGIYASILFPVPVIGCAVAQHCYNGDDSFLWENGKFEPL